MRIVTVEDLTNKLDQDLAWRKKELSFIADKILEEGCDFKEPYFLSKKQALKELKQNSNMAKRIIEFYKTNIKRITAIVPHKPAQNILVNESLPKEAPIVC